MTTVEERFGYRFRDQDLLRTALRHRSSAQASPQNPPDNERLEFLGDALLGFLVGEGLLSRLPTHDEGRLTKVKARLVSAEGLLEVARRLELGSALELSEAEERNGGREKKSILADAVEALIAAAYYDGGLEAARDIVERHFLMPQRLASMEEGLETDNAKSTLQELLQGRPGPLPEYRLLNEEGPPHDRVFTVEVVVGDRLKMSAEGRTKKAAEQRAARRALDALRRDPA